MRLWTPCGIRPDWTLRLSYQYGYVSVARNPLDGHVVAAFLPDMSTESYQAFLDFLRKESPGISLRLYRDNAAAHTTKDITTPHRKALNERSYQRIVRNSIRRNDSSRNSVFCLPTRSLRVWRRLKRQSPPYCRNTGRIPNSCRV